MAFWHQQTKRAAILDRREARDCKRSRGGVHISAGVEEVTSEAQVAHVVKQEQVVVPEVQTVQKNKVPQIVQKNIETLHQQILDFEAVLTDETSLANKDMDAAKRGLAALAENSESKAAAVEDVTSEAHVGESEAAPPVHISLASLRLQSQRLASKTQQTAHVVKQEQVVVPEVQTVQKHKVPQIVQKHIEMLHQQILDFEADFEAVLTDETNLANKDMDTAKKGLAESSESKAAAEGDLHMGVTTKVRVKKAWL